MLAQRPTGPHATRTPFECFATNLPATTQLRTPVRAAHQRRAIEQQYQELKDELGLGRAPTLPVVRVVLQVVLTAHSFVTTPGYFEYMLKLRDSQLRI